MLAHRGFGPRGRLGSGWWLGISALVLGCSFERFESSPAGCASGTQCTDGGKLPSSSSEPTSADDGTAPEPTNSDDPAQTNSDDPAQTSPDDAPSGDEPASDIDGGNETPPPVEPVAECDPPSTDHVRAYFEVPGAEGALEGDYFRLPFPNDFYLTDGKLDLGAFPRVTSTAGLFVDSLNEIGSGFSASPTILFRFSGKINFADTLIARFHVVDVTDPAAPSSPPLKLLYSPQGGKYVCHNWLGVRPSPGHALSPGHTYAAWLEKGVQADNGLEVEAAANFTALVDDATPSDPLLAALHAKYDPLRVYLTTQSIDPKTLLNATVFTVGQVRTPMQTLAQLVDAAATPAVSDWVRCGPDAVSPCPDVSGPRACGEANDLYEEYHALVEIPIFQQGDPPYFDSGGEIDLTGPVRSEKICMSLTVPTGTPPEEGYPVLLAAHGAGGSFRSAIRPEAAGRLSEAATPSGKVRRFAVLGYDGVQHGPRRGNDPLSSEMDPDLLLFNFLNPIGTLGTSLQGGVDVLSMARLAKNLELPVEISGRAEAFFDHRSVFFWGHSQGAMQGAIALAYTDDVSTAVFSGLGAGFLQTLLLRQDPELVPKAVRQAVFDPADDGQLVFGGEYHPALALVQQLVDAADPLNHARLLLSASQSNPLHVFQVYGDGDRYAPGIAQQSFAIAAGLAVAQTDSSATAPEDIGDVDPMFPLVGNVTIGAGQFTAGVREYGPATGQNGHLVAYSVDAAGLDIATFLAMAADGETPQIGR